MEMEVCYGGGVKVEVHYKGHVIHTDQPVSNGGENTAPTPFDYFFASIGSCVGFYVYSFCKQRDLAPEKIRVELSRETNHEKGMISKVDIKIVVPSDFPQKYHDALLRVADGCTVKKHLLEPPQIDICVDVRD